MGSLSRGIHHTRPGTTTTWEATWQTKLNRPERCYSKSEAQLKNIHSNDSREFWLRVTCKTPGLWWGLPPVQRITFAFGEDKTCDVMWQAVGSM